MAVEDVRLVILSDRIELEGYSDEATLQDLVRGIERVRLRSDLKVSRCAGCGGCCRQPIPVLGVDLANLATALSAPDERSVLERLAVPDVRPSGHERRAAIRKLSRDTGLSLEQAEWIYDYNNGEQVSPRRADNGSCEFLRGGMCTIYELRPLVCRLYLCTMGDRLSVMQENISRQGVWHLYEHVGWLCRDDIASNPFVQVRSYEEARLSAFAWDPGTLDDGLLGCQ